MPTRANSGDFDVYGIPWDRSRAPEYPRPRVLRLHRAAASPGSLAPSLPLGTLGVSPFSPSPISGVRLFPS